MSRHTRRRSPLQIELTVVGAGILAAAAAVTAVSVAWAGEVEHGHDTVEKAGADHAVFVQGDELVGNTIHVFKRAQDGTLSAAGGYATGGKGGDQVDAPTDSLASHGLTRLRRPVPAAPRGQRGQQHRHVVPGPRDRN
ncbi:hypothetical protein [Streptomyces hokutonensis]|uniref:Uncharacterized protein n=1 Tax=Streptomyces hokutonensis TaxID=1306990 RepID=A0ABW6MKF1_9ACTN